MADPLMAPLSSGPNCDTCELRPSGCEGQAAIRAVDAVNITYDVLDSMDRPASEIVMGRMLGEAAALGAFLPGFDDLRSTVGDGLNLCPGAVEEPPVRQNSMALRLAPKPIPGVSNMVSPVFARPDLGPQGSSATVPEKDLPYIAAQRLKGAATAILNAASDYSPQSEPTSPSNIPARRVALPRTR